MTTALCPACLGVWELPKDIPGVLRTSALCAKCKSRKDGREWDKEYDPNVRNPAIEEQMRDIGRKIKESLPPTHGFTLFLFSYDESETFYISSAQRPDMLKVLREFLKRQES